jgi:chaperonin GroES|tara:strand:- start:62 stop:364 length:303 start_codon:yes stop_codon:yes gene_type:complete
MKMKPMGDQILVKRKKDENKTKSGIIISAEASEFGYAEVIAVGPGIFTQTGDRIKMTCRVGDTILVPSRLLSGKNGNQVTFEDINYLLMRESEVAMVSTK